MSSALLQISHIAKSFGGNQVLTDVNLLVRPGEIVGLLGPNGSGKSTLLNAASGFMPTDSGLVSFMGNDITRVPAHEIVRFSIARTFQLPSMPAKMTVLEVVVTAGSQHAGVLRSLWPTAQDRMREQESIRKAHELLDSLLLTRVKDLPAASLSGGQKKLLSIACALMGEPKLLMLDEPTAGVHPNLRRDIVSILKRLNQNGISQLIVEHDMFFIREVCTRCVVLDRGHIVADCSPDELISNPKVVEAYLGRAEQPLKQKLEVA